MRRGVIIRVTSSVESHEMKERERKNPAAEVRDMLQPGVRFGECVITACQSRKAATVMQIEFSFHPYIMDCRGVPDVEREKRRYLHAFRLRIELYLSLSRIPM